MDLEVFRTGKHFSAARKGTGKRLLARMHSNMIHQLIFRLEGAALARTVFPIAGVVRNFGSTDVFYGNVRYNFVQGTEDFVARFPWRRHIWIDPETCHFLLNRVSHVAQKCTGGVMRRHPHAIHIRRRRVHLVGGTSHLMGRSGAPVGGRHPRQSRSGHSLHWVMQRRERIGRRVRVSRRVKAAREHRMVIIWPSEKQVSRVVTGVTILSVIRNGG